MSFRFCLGARLMLACALVAGASSSAFGQTAPAPAQPPVQVPPSTTPSAKGLEPTGPVRQLSMDEAVKLAIEQNLGIQIERFNPELQDLNTAQILANYTPQFGAGVFTQSQDQPPSSFLSGSDTTVASDNFGFTTNLTKLFPWGTEAVVAFDSGRQTTTNSFSSFNPTLSGNLDVVVTQPLLRNFKFDTVRQQLFASRANRAIADVDVRQTVALTERTVRNSYLGLRLRHQRAEGRAADAGPGAGVAAQHAVARGDRHPGPHRRRAGGVRSRQPRGSGDSGGSVHRSVRGSAPIADLRPEDAGIFRTCASSRPTCPNCSSRKWMSRRPWNGPSRSGRT